MMYKIRHKWSTAFTKDSFTVEFKASLRSESTNHVLNNIVNTTISFTNFVIKYESVLAGMRSSEFNEDFRCKRGTLQRAVKKSGIFNFDHFNSNISCSCKKFESLGILCCHALRVFNLKNLTKIPS